MTDPTEHTEREGGSGRRELLASLAALGTLGGAGCLRFESADSAATGTSSAASDTASSDGADQGPSSRTDAGTPSGTAASDSTGTPTGTPTGQSVDPLSTDWPGYRADDGNTAAVPGATLPDGEFTVEFETNTEVTRGVTLRDEVVYGASGTTVVAHRATDGKQQWAYEADASFKQLPEVTEEVVLVSEYKGPVVGIDRAEGTPRWAFDRFQADGQYVVSPIPARDGVAYFGVVIAGVGKYHLYALDVATGELQWQRQTSEKVLTAPAIGEDLFFVANYGGSLVAYDRETGDQQWESDIGRGTLDPVLGDETVYVTGEKLRAFDRATGERRWETVVNSTAAPAVADGTAFVSTSTDYLLAVAASDGSVVWEKDLESIGGPPIVADDVVCLEADGALRGFDVESGERRLTIDLGDDDVKGTPIATDGSLLYGTAAKLVRLTP